MQNNNSKLNTVLLVVLIILVGFGIWKLSYQKGVSKIMTNKVYDSNVQTQSQLPSIMNSKSQPTQNQQSVKIYQGNGFLFRYTGDATIASSGVLSNGSYVDITRGKALAQVKFYPNASNTKPFDANSVSSQQVLINGKLFYYSDVEVEGGVTGRSYWYSHNGKLITIGGYVGDLSLIDLGSIEI